MNNSQNKQHRAPERGIAMITALFALLILSALAVGMMYLATTDTQINANYKESEQSYWGARAGLEEVRARMMTVGGDLLASAPTGLPPTANSVLYVVNPGINPISGLSDGAMQPWDMTSRYYDTTLCNAFSVQMLISCNSPASYTAANGINAGTVQSLNPFVGQVNSLPYKWVRVTLKANNSSGFPVQAAGDPVPNNTTPICWDGQQQLIKPAAYAPRCDSNPIVPAGVADSPRLTPVYILTSYAVTPAGSGRYVQMDIANNPPFHHQRCCGLHR